MKIDLHVHSSERSGCGRSTEIEQIEAAIGFGLDGIVFTDHDVLVPYNRLAELNKLYAPFRIFSGIEIHMKESADDMLVIGVYDDILQRREGWRYEEIFRFCEDNNAFLIHAHPYRYSEVMEISVDKFPPHAIEIASVNVKPHTIEPLKKYVKRSKQSKTIMNSDSHYYLNTGLWYSTFEEKIGTDEKLVEMLKAGRYVSQKAEGRSVVK